MQLTQRTTKQESFYPLGHSAHFYSNLNTQRAHDVNITPPQRRCNVMTLHRRWGDVIFTSCACWVVALLWNLLSTIYENNQYHENYLSIKIQFRILTFMQTNCLYQNKYLIRPQPTHPHHPHQYMTRNVTRISYKQSSEVQGKMQTENLLKLQCF